MIVLGKWLPTILLYSAAAGLFAATLLAGYGPRLTMVIAGAVLLVAGRIAAHFADADGRARAIERQQQNSSRAMRGTPPAPSHSEQGEYIGDK